jgi:hypothetical protein
MSEELENKSQGHEGPIVAGRIANSGEPIRFANAQRLDGVSAHSALPGQNVKVWCRLATTSADPMFHRMVESFSAAIGHDAAQNQMAIPALDGAKVVLYVMREDGTAELWIDNMAISMTCVVRRDVEAMTFIFEHDLADVLDMRFPCIEIQEADRVLCLFREGWRYALAFDFNPEGKLDLPAFSRTLGSLHRELRYRHIYDAMEDEVLFNRLSMAGWFPFAEILTSNFKELLEHCQANFPLADVEEKLLAAFNKERLENIFRRWMARPHFAAKEALLKSAIDAFSRSDAVATIKILLTEIEGVMAEAYRAVHGQSAKTKELLRFVIAAAEQRAGQPNSLMLPAAFARYLDTYTFANFDPVAQNGTAGSRHAVGHGAAAADTYTMTRALQAILTLDQIAFFT